MPDGLSMIREPTVARPVVLAIFVAALVATSASAHRIPFPKRDLLRLDGERLELVVSYDIDEGEDAWWIRDRLDPGGDGVLDSEESRHAERLLAERVIRPVKVWIDGRRLDLHITAISCEGLDPAEPRAHPGEGDEGRLGGEPQSRRGMGVTVVLEGAVPPSQKAFRLRLEDRVEQGGHPVVVALEARGRRIVEASAGRLERRDERGVDAVVGAELEAEVPFVAVLGPSR